MGLQPQLEGRREDNESRIQRQGQKQAMVKTDVADVRYLTPGSVVQRQSVGQYPEFQ